MAKEATTTRTRPATPAPKSFDVYGTARRTSGYSVGQQLSKKEAWIRPYWFFAPYMRAMLTHKLWLLPCDVNTEVKNSDLASQLTNVGSERDFSSLLAARVGNDVNEKFVSGVGALNQAETEAVITLDLTGPMFFGVRLKLATSIENLNYSVVKVQVYNDSTLMDTFHILMNQPTSELVFLLPGQVNGVINPTGSAKTKVILTLDKSYATKFFGYAQGLNARDLPGATPQKSFMNDSAQ